jgi:soluble lytic murein transglycosylase-like protein
MAIKPLLRSAADANQLDMALLQAVIAAESGFDPSAVSPKGAVGLMQVMPATAQRYGVASDRGGSVAVKLTDPRTNINTGARYLRDLVNLFPGQLELAVAAYNAGEGAVQKAGNKIPAYKETQNYVRSVMGLYNRLNPQSQRMVVSAQLAPTELSN